MRSSARMFNTAVAACSASGVFDILALYKLDYYYYYYYTAML